MPQAAPERSDLGMIGLERLPSRGGALGEGEDQVGQRRRERYLHGVDAEDRVRGGGGQSRREAAGDPLVLEVEIHA